MAALLLANEWISNNTFSPVPYVNRQIAKEIAMKTGLRVFSTVLDSKIPKGVEDDARESNVELIGPEVEKKEAKYFKESSIQLLMAFKQFYPQISDLHMDLPIRLVVGHAICGDDNVHTADVACNIIDKVCKDAHLWIFIHFTPDHLLNVTKEFKKSGSTRQEKEKEIQEYVTMSTLVAAVGPRVFDYCCNQFRMDAYKMLCYLPYPEDQFLDLIASPANVDRHAEILMICNLPVDRRRLSQQLARFDSIIEAICKVSVNLKTINPKVVPTFKVHLNGVSGNVLETKLIDKIGSIPGPSNLRIAASNSTEIHDVLNALKACTVLVDGDYGSTFSIIGLNCLAAGTPCLLSSHCGLAKFISDDEHLQDHSDNIIVDVGAGYNQPDVVDEWTAPMSKLFGNYKSHFRRSKRLKDLIKASATDGAIAKSLKTLIDQCPRSEVDGAATPPLVDQGAGSSSVSGLPANRGHDHGAYTGESTSALVSSSQNQTLEPRDSKSNQKDAENLDVKVTVEDSMRIESQASVDKNVLEDIKKADQLAHTKKYLGENGITMGDPSHGESLIVPVRVTTLEGLETIWSDMWSGKLGKVFRKDLITKDVLKRLKTTTIDVKTNIRTWQYRYCKELLELRRTEEQCVSSSEGPKTEELPLRIRQATKVIQDPIHGTIELDPVYMSIIDTPEFQRLRDIKKLGTVHFVYPGSIHTRFEHSIGRCYLALKFVRHLKENYQNTLGITKEEELCIGLAALCLDLGLGPFSNLFEERIIPALRPRGYEDFTTTLASVKIFDLMVKRYNLREIFKAYGYKMAKNEFHLVKEMIYGPHEHGNNYGKVYSYQATSPYRYFLYQIVSNRRNRIDASEWDGLARDSYHLGIVHGNSMHERFIKFARVLHVPSKMKQRREKHICFRDKEVPSACEMLRARYRQRRLTTFHQVKIAVDLMITDALVAAASYLKLQKENGEVVGMGEILNDMDVYMTLDDTIYNEILKSYGNENLSEARSILQKIQKRELYKVVYKAEAPPDLTEQDIKAKDIVESSANNGSLQENDLIFTIISMDYGIGDENPIDNMMFYSKEDLVPRYALPEEISHLIPKTFQERRLFVYVRDDRKKGVASRCLNEWAKKKGLLKETETDILGTSQYSRSKDHVPLQTGIKREVEESYDDKTVSKMGKFD